MTAISTSANRIRFTTAGVLSSFLALIILFPVLSVLWLAFNPTENIWPFLWDTTLPRYLANTIVLLVSVGFLSAVIGCVSAWLICIYDFPGRKWFEWLLFAPLAIPAYVGAYAITDFLEYAGPLQSGLRAVFGWSSAADYPFFEIRSRGSAIVVLTSVLYPYVYLLTRAAIREQSSAIYEVARTLGCGGASLFLRIGLPMMRPAVAVGAAIAMMETVADFGVVDFFAVQTLTTGIFSVWLEQNNAGGASQIALCAVGLIMILLTLERISRRNLRFHQSSRQVRKFRRWSLRGVSAVGAVSFCAVPILVGFVLPVFVMFGHAAADLGTLLAPDLLEAFYRSIILGLSVATITASLGVALVYSVRLTGAQWPRLLLPITGIGYALPGAVLGIGVLVPLAALDNGFADFVWATTGYDPGLLLTGTGFAVVFACSVRFFAIAQGAADGAMGRISPSIPMASRSLGQNARQTLRRVYLPLINPSLGTAFLLVFVDTIKELPMTLFLRPFNFHTLATYTYERASLEKIAEAAGPSLLISAVGMISVVLIIRSNR